MTGLLLAPESTALGAPVVEVATGSTRFPDMQ